MTLQPPRPTRQRFGQGRRNRGVEYDIAALTPRAIQRAKPRTRERMPGFLEPSIASGVSSPPRVKEPRELLDHRATEGRSNLLPKCLLVRRARTLEMPRNEKPNGPLGKRPQELGVPLQEQPKVH